jgi:hypothetical protein
MMSQEKIDILKQMLEVQGADGNWNYDAYMLGMYNGMEYSLAILENREPNYRNAPEQWKDVPEFKPLFKFPRSEESCPHNNVESWNHGYHSRCKDCGEEDV